MSPVTLYVGHSKGIIFHELSARVVTDNKEYYTVLEIFRPKKEEKSIDCLSAHMKI